MREIGTAKVFNWFSSLSPVFFFNEKNRKSLVMVMRWIY